MTRETHLRSLVKAVSWRFCGTLATMLIVYVITGKANAAFYVGFFEFFSKIVFFYFHERIWSLIRFGRSMDLREGEL